jgi:hypothetical protein
MEQSPVTETVRYGRRWIVVAGVLVLLLVAFGLWARARGLAGSAGRSARELFAPEERAPDGVRIRVEILNATATPRLALGATRLLRDRGFDVVSIGNSPTRRESTLVIDRTNHPEWAALVARILGGAATDARADTSRYVDISVLLGPDWTPPAKTLYP